MTSWSLGRKLWPKSLLGFCSGSPLICDDDRCANVMWDLSVGWAGARALVVTAVRCCLFAMVTIVCHMARGGKRGGFNRTMFAQDFVKVQRHIWSLNPHTYPHFPVLLSRPGLQLHGSSMLLVAVCRLWTPWSWVAVGSLNHIQHSPLLQDHLYRERLAHAMQWSTQLTFTHHHAAEQRAGQGPVTSGSFITMSAVPSGIKMGVWIDLRLLAVNKCVMLVGFFL